MGDLRRMGDHEALGKLGGKLATGSRGAPPSARPNTTRKRPRADAPTPDELRARARALLAQAAPAAASTPSLTSAPRESVCAQCGGAGRVLVWVGPEDWRTKDVACGCAANRLAARALAASDMTPKLRAMDFAGYDALFGGNQVALAAVSDWTRGLCCAREGHMALLPWLLLYGGFGTGKTHLLASAFNVLLGTGRYPLYTVVPALLKHIRDGLDEPDSREYGARFRAVRSAPILLLDDLGAERSTPWSDELLFKLLDYRYREMLPTAVATNLIPADLEPRIASRLQDRALSTVVLMHGPDYRLSDREKGATR